MKTLECGTCDDYAIDQPDKLVSHYMSFHHLNISDAKLLVANVTGDVATGQAWFDRFYEDLKSYAEMKRRGDFNKDQRFRGVLNKGIVLEIARRAANI